MCTSTEQVEIYIKNVQLYCKYLLYRITVCAHISVTVSHYFSYFHEFFSLDSRKRGERIHVHTKVFAVLPQ